MTSEEFKALEDQLWQTADTIRANSDLKSSEYATPVLGMIFLKFADNKYSQFEDDILAEYAKLKGTRREKKIHEIAIVKRERDKKGTDLFFLTLYQKPNHSTNH